MTNDQNLQSYILNLKSLSPLTAMPRPSKANLQRDAAAAVLREAGTPLTKAEVARRAGISPDSTTVVFRDPRFWVTRDKLLWLTGLADPFHPLDAVPAPPPKPVKPKPVYQATPTDFKRLIRAQGPLRLGDIARITGVRQCTCFAILSGPDFERDTDGLYWNAKSKQKPGRKPHDDRTGS